MRFCGAYHGWWGDVQPGVGNPTPARETYTLKDMDDDTLRVLRRAQATSPACWSTRCRRCTPTPTRPAIRRWSTAVAPPRFDRAAYTAWLQQLREVCTERGIVLIFDEVFVGFRLAPGGAQEYFGVQADMVTYGKTLGGGLPVGVVCGAPELMKRFRDDRPADICFARGTFNAHPYVMGAMNVFLQRLDTPEVAALVRATSTSVWNARAAAAQRSACAPKACRCRWPTCRRSGPSSTRSRPATTGCCSSTCAREGLALSWVGTGRLIFSLNYSDADFEAVADSFVAAARAMQARRLVVVGRRR